MSRTAVVLFNLGGPDSLEAVHPFLFNLFNDPAIISLPKPFRFLLAKLIAFLRAGKARAIYQQIGGKSPILDQTLAQAAALEEKLKAKGEYKIFVCMRHWHPMSDVVVKKVKAFEPEHVILLPLYPQYSTTTTGSAFTDWEKASALAGLRAPVTKICCYPVEHTFIAAHAKLVREMYWKASEEGKPRVLFSAHGLPEKVVLSGDPYQWQVERTVDAVVDILSIDEMDYVTCYQSKVGPMRWLSPSTEEEIIAAGEEKRPVLVVPVTFVSEHSETLVELDIEYRRLAAKHSVPGYWRTPALGIEPLFIEALAGLCLGIDRKQLVRSFQGTRYCPGAFDQCPCSV